MLEFDFIEFSVDRVQKSVEDAVEGALDAVKEHKNNLRLSVLRTSEGGSSTGNRGFVKFQ